jgi:cytochrome c
MLLPLALLVQGSPALPVEDLPDPERFERVILATALDRPLELAVGPDGRVYFIELSGRLAFYDPARGRVVDVAQIPVFAEQENGLLGLALDPAFAENHWIYLLHSPTDYSGQRLSRYTLAGDAIVEGSEHVLLAFEEQRVECCHHAGSLAFGPDGLLFVATGDNTNPAGDSEGFAPIDEREGRAPFDAQKGPSNTQSLSGKILRIRPTPEGSYEIPTGNLFAAPEDGRPEIYAMGCRNPWRISVDARTGYLYWGEVGPDAGGDGPRGPMGYDEINQARAAGNFGWPYFIADNQAYPDVDFASGAIGVRGDPARPENLSPNNKGARFLPPAQPAWIYYPYGPSARFPELDAPGGRTACAGPVYRFDPALASPTKLPAYYDGCLFAYEWSRNWIKAVRLDEDSRPAEILPFLPSVSFLRPVDLAIGPEGALYLLEYGTTWGTNADSKLVRTDYVRGNRAPLARASVENNIGAVPLSVKLSAAESRDKDAEDELSYEWRILPDARVASSAREVELDFATPGTFEVELAVTDRAGARTTAIVPVLAGNSRPSVWIDAPADGSFFDWGEPIEYTVYAEDEEDGDSESNPFDFLPRTVVTATFHPGPPPGGEGENGDERLDRGLAQMKQSDCFHCHALDARVVGPAYREVAARYHADREALETAARRVLTGSSGVWGDHPMLPHAQLSIEDARAMVAWIATLALEQPTLRSVSEGTHGTIELASPADPRPCGCWTIDATFTDSGSAPVGPLAASARAILRSRRVEAEHWSSHAGTQVLESASASGGRFVGAVDHDSHLVFPHLVLAGITRVGASVSSAGPGGTIALHANAADGPVLASFRVVPNGAWEEWFELESPLEPTPEPCDLFVVFTNPEQPSALLNLDWLEFRR